MAGGTDGMPGFGGDRAASFRAVAQSVQDALIAADAHSRIVFWNPSAERIFGWTAAEALGEPLTMLMPEAFREPHRQGIARVRDGGERHVLGGPPVELVGLRRDGSEFPIELSLGSWTDDDGAEPCFTGVVRDVSERAQARRVAAAQYEVAAALAGSQALDEGVVRALEAIGAAMGWRLGQLWVAEPGAEALRLRVAWHEDDDALRAFRATSEAMTFAPGHGLPGRVWETGRSAWLADVMEDDNFPRSDSAAHAGLHAGVAVPLVAEGKTRGVVEFFGAREQPPDEDLLTAMEALGSQLAQFLLRREAEAELAERERLQHQAAELNDAVVQGLALASYHLAQAQAEDAADAVSATLQAAKQIVSDLLEGIEIEPGRLRRSTAARLPGDPTD
jgi:PAS domain S-box-containing protein